MLRLKNNSLSMTNQDLDTIQNQEKELGILGSLEKCCAEESINIKDIYDIELDVSQMCDKKYCDICARIICALLNKNN